MIERFIEFTSNISQAYKHIIRIKSAKMADYGLKASHVMCLFYLGKNPGGLTAGELITLCREDKAGISKCLNELKKQRLIEIDDDNGARKYRAKYRITPEGAAIFDEISGIIVNVVEKCGADLTEEERAIFYRSLGTIVRNLEKISSEMETIDACD
ncbi:MAG: MarR family transcriptional regulator [Clostridiales bacterium]|nr:MarR family transcriptional regulator [Clostridiales bacterium]